MKRLFKLSKPWSSAERKVLSDRVKGPYPETAYDYGPFVIYRVEWSLPAGSEWFALFERLGSRAIYHVVASEDTRDALLSDLDDETHEAIREWTATTEEAK